MPQSDAFSNRCTINTPTFSTKVSVVLFFWSTQVYETPTTSRYRRTHGLQPKSLVMLSVMDITHNLEFKIAESLRLTICRLEVRLHAVLTLFSSVSGGPREW